jgi:hypothetical protein
MRSVGEDERQAYQGEELSTTKYHEMFVQAKPMSQLIGSLNTGILG